MSGPDDRDPVELCVDEHGDPADPLVVLVHGAAASMDWWDPGLCDAIADRGRRVVRYDHRDTGRSTTGRPGHPDYDGGVLERDLVALVEALGAPAHLVGLSMGGGIAQSVALRRPGLVSGLTLVATTAVGGVDADLPGMSAELQAWFADPPPPPDWDDRDAVVAAQVAAQRAFAGPDFDESRARRIAGEAVDRSIDPAAADNHWLVIGSGDEDGPPLDVRRIAVPTLVVHGTHDPMFPLPHGEALAAAIPGARLLVVDRMGHETPPRSAWKDVVPDLSVVDRGDRDAQAGYDG
ncbi:alpha/beta hydrolase [Nocardioides aestuarii]|uniref:Alpha/beta fold hydrolase n=1 Tax=Nocardioides aestuarii TaxID=252231 RepID=A0ABW4THS1_9ACTN